MAFAKFTATLVTSNPFCYLVTQNSKPANSYLLCFCSQAEISELQQLLVSKDTEIECLQTQLLARGGTANNNAERGMHG